MRIIHTSDWHLGKHLEGKSRLEEQEKFCEDFINIVEENNIDMIIIAGDIYDTGNPPAKAERLFYKTVKRLSDGGRRAVLIIAGNHDNPDRLSAASPLAYEHGVIIQGLPKSIAVTGEFGGFKIINSKEGLIELEMNDEKAVILTLPYPSEKRLNDIYSEDVDENEMQRNYSEKIGQIFDKLQENYREDTINIAISHLFLTGGQECDSERPIQLGGSYAVSPMHLPKKAQYIALGHLHRPQKFTKELNAFYSGSPLQYSKSEINYSKCVYMIDIKPNDKPIVEEIYLKNYKPIEIFKCSSIEEALDLCNEHKEREIWAYFEIETDRILTQSEIKEMKKLIPDIIEIKPIIKGNDEDENMINDMKEKSLGELFVEFFKNTHDLEPGEEIKDLFLSLMNEEEDEDETVKA